MRNLFLRFFLSVWTAMVLVLVFTVLGTAWLANERRESDLERQDALAREASQVLGENGVPGLTEWLRSQQQQLQANRPDRIYVIDDAGKDLLGRHVPDYLQARVGRRPFPQQRANRPERDERLLSRLVSASNESFQLSLSSLRRPFGALGPREPMIIAGVLTLLLSAGVCFLLARYLSAPIQALRTATHRIAAGDLGVRVAGVVGKRSDALAQLAVDFDAMSVRLRALLESHQTLLRDVSHELRSPLARLQIALGLARRPAANLGQEFDRIEQEAQRLDDLIGEILSLSRLDDPARKLEQEDVDLPELLEQLVDNARLEAAPRAVTIELHSIPDLHLHGDRELLYRAIENVLRNAVRFSPVGGQVSVDATVAGTAIQITINDQGPGVPAESLQRIFEPFYRVSDARDRDSGGNGVGLAITARVVKLHDGTVTAANRPAGGLQVAIRLAPSMLR
jgi:two-component system sensor histidine kinase CpxA